MWICVVQKSLNQNDIIRNHSGSALFKCYRGDYCSFININGNKLNVIKKEKLI